MARTFRRPLSPEEQRRARNRRIIYVLLGLVAVILLVVLAAYLRFTGGPALPAEVRQRVRAEQQQAKAPGGTPARPPAAVPPGTPPLRQQVAQLQQAVATADTTPRTLYVTDSELNAELVGAVQQRQEVKEVKAYFAQDLAYLVTRVEVRGQVLTITLRLHPVIVNGGLQFEIDAAHIGGMAAPEKLVAAARAELRKKGNLFEPDRTGLYIQTAELKPGVAILTGRPVPRK